MAANFVSRAASRLAIPRAVRPAFALLVLAPLAVAPTPSRSAEETPTQAPHATAETAAPVAGKPRGHNVLTWPIYVRWDSENGNALRVYGPATVSWRSEREGSFYLLWPTTGVRQFTTGRSDHRLLWPVIDRVRDPARGYTALRLATRLVEYERQSNENVQSLRLSPLYTNLRTVSGVRTFEIAPLYFRHENPRARDRVIELGYVPWLGGNGFSLYRSWTGTRAYGWNAALCYGGLRSPETRWLWLPPYVSGDRSGGSGAPARFRALVPLYARFTSRDNRWWSAGLVFGGGLSATGAWLSVPPYFSYERLAGSNSPAGLNGLIPLYTAWHSPDLGWWNFAVLYNGGRSAERTWLYAPPFFSQSHHPATGGGSSYHTLVPIYGVWHSPRRDLALALPSLWRYRSERMSASGLWPLYAWFRQTGTDSLSRSGGSVAWPLITWGRGNRYRALGILPFYYRLVDGAAATTLAPPIYASFLRPDLDGRIFVPAYLRWWSKADSLEAITLYYRRWNAKRRIQGLFPLQESFRSAALRREYLIPVYYHRKDGVGEQRLVLPVWADWRSTVDDRSTRFIGPVVLTRGHRSHGFGVVPIRRPGASDLYLLPLSSYRARADGRRAVDVLWPLYTRRRQADGSTRSALLFWLGLDETRGEHRRAWLQPIYYYDRSSRESSYFAVLGGVLCSYERDGPQRKLKALLIPVRTWRKS
ncbi:MAG: hypothetical protein E6K72_01840 [Candidatus Eisenbacteria bacterium]|uniref:Uncharacterized protein n=1 Tax=Eiseniibacteriota bacterium TaxID=2212470 RepID=A0A538T6C0_UNCEI|nr:MAG: hypothetical protein E6K72_01840 [Candidatus Eisenbacteria bacterium]